MTAPLYTPENCRAAYRLNWSLSIFWNAPAPGAGWLGALAEAVQTDGIRILEHRDIKTNVSQFLISTRPETAPADIARSVKGRLQYLVRESAPKAFRRNYGLRSVGEARGDVVQEYVRTQTQHHAMADPRVQKRIEALSIEGIGSALLKPRLASHAQFCYNLHLALVNRDRGMDLRTGLLERRRDRLSAIAAKKSHLIGVGHVLPDHLHLTLGCNLGESPGDVARSYMNNLAHAEGMKPIFEYGFYAGTFGEYDLGAVRRGLANQS
jgi:REP element-mobilizing transposase RayT